MKRTIGEDTQIGALRREEMLHDRHLADIPSARAICYRTVRVSWKGKVTQDIYATMTSGIEVA